MTTEVIAKVEHTKIKYLKLTDDNNNKKKKPKKYKWDIVWTNVILMTLLHLGALYGLYVRPSGKFQSHLFWKFIVLCLGLGVTGGAHRLWSHRSYKANTICQIILMLMMSCTYQNSIYTWSRDHRLHHKYSETDADPHNAKRGFFFSHMGWLLVKKHPQVKEKGKTIIMTDLEENPVVMFQHKYYLLLVLIFGVLIPTFVPWYFWNESLQYTFFTGTIYRYILTSHVIWCINSVAHLHGQKPFDKHIGPTQNLVLFYTNYGEGFHNYHHTFPWDYKTSEIGSDSRNLTTMMIDFFAWLGWVTERKSVPEYIIQKRAERNGDGTYQKPSHKSFKFIVNIKYSTLKNIRDFIIFWTYLYLI